MDTNYPAFIVTGCDTEAGKTFVSAVLMKAFRGTYWKPIQSGAATDSDLSTIQRLTRLGDDHFMGELYKLQQPLSPHQAAKIDGVTIDPKRITLPKVDEIHHTPLIIEGAGGVMVPITDSYLMIDLFVDLQLPVLVVCRNRLGVINHMLMTLEVLKSRSIRVMGFISSGGDGNPDNLDTISRLSDVPLLIALPEMILVNHKETDAMSSSIDTQSILRSGGFECGSNSCL
jgi:dethiobiotin synthase